MVWNLMIRSNCKIHSQSIFDLSNFGIQKYLPTQKFLVAILFSTQVSFILHNIWWTNKNSGLSIFAAQIFPGPKIFEAKLINDIQIVGNKKLLEAHHDFGIKNIF